MHDHINYTYHDLMHGKQPPHHYTRPHVNTDVHKQCIINHTLMMTHSPITPSTSHGNLTGTIYHTIQMQQAHNLTTQETQMKPT